MGRKFAISFLSVLALFGLALGVAFAETIVPKNVIYNKSVNENAEAKVCQLVLNVNSPPAPEAVIASAVVGWDKRQRVIEVAFALGVFDVIKSEDKLQGRAVRLISAGFSSDHFNTAGLVQQGAEDDAVWIWMDRDNARPFLEAFTAGNFRLIFARAGSGEARTYQVTPPPAEALRDDFMKCVFGLLPKVSSAGVAFGASGSRDGLNRLAIEYAASSSHAMKSSHNAIMHAASPLAQR